MTRLAPRTKQLKRNKKSAKHDTPMSTDAQRGVFVHTDRLALIVTVPVEFVQFLCHLKTRRCGWEKKLVLHTSLRKFG